MNKIWFDAYSNLIAEDEEYKLISSDMINQPTSSLKSKLIIKLHDDLFLYSTQTQMNSVDTRTLMIKKTSTILFSQDV